LARNLVACGREANPGALEGFAVLARAVHPS